MYTDTFWPLNPFAQLYAHSAYRDLLALPTFPTLPIEIEQSNLSVKVVPLTYLPSLTRFLATSVPEFQLGFQKIDELTLSVPSEEPVFKNIAPHTLDAHYYISLDIHEKEKVANLKLYQVYGESMVIHSSQKLSTMYPSIEEILALATQELQLTDANLNGNITFFSAKKDHLYFSFIARMYGAQKTEKLSLEKFKSWCTQLSVLWK